MTCWTYFLATDFNELIAMDLSSDNSKETEHWRQIKQTIKKSNFILLASSEANEPIPTAYSPWPHKENLALVKHIFFPGCSPFCE